MKGFNETRLIKNLYCVFSNFWPYCFCFRLLQSCLIPSVQFWRWGKWVALKRKHTSNVCWKFRTYFICVMHAYSVPLTGFIFTPLESVTNCVPKSFFNKSFLRLIFFYVIFPIPLLRYWNLLADYALVYMHLCST